MTTKIRIRGFCPACGTERLIATYDDVIRCVNPDCADRQAVAKLLAEPETDHVVHFIDGDFTIKHPLTERVNLFTCRLHQFLTMRPYQGLTGRFTAVSDEAGWRLTNIDDIFINYAPRP